MEDLTVKWQSLPCLNDPTIPLISTHGTDEVRKNTGCWITGVVYWFAIIFGEVILKNKFFGNKGKVRNVFQNNWLKRKKIY